MAGGRVADARTAAWYLTSPPATRTSVAERPRVTALIETAVARHRIVVLAAPSGYGKTIAVSSWARTLDGPLAWLTLTRMGTQREDVDAGVLASVVRAVTASRQRQEAAWVGVPPEPHSAVGAHRLVASLVGLSTDTLTLVVDDLSAAGAAVAGSVIPLLAEHEIPNLRVVLIGQDIPFPHANLALSGELTTIGAAALALTVDEATSLREASGEPGLPLDVTEVVRATNGWPAAVRLLLMEGVAPGHPSPGVPLLHDFFGEQVLDVLSPELTDFVLAATTCSRLDAELARVLTERADAQRLLEECIRRGLFLERFVEEPHGTIYRWHGLFVELCRAALERRDPNRGDELNEIAAKELSRRGFPAAGTRYALRAHRPELAADILCGHWLTVLLQSSGAQTAELITTLPEPWVSRPELLLARACCLDVMGERLGARLTYERAALSAPESDASAEQVSVMQALAELMIADDSPTMSVAADELRHALPRAVELSASVRATALFILGRAEIRLRRDLTRNVEILRTAVTECERAGLHDIAVQARTNLAFATAFAGDLDGALTILDAATVGGPEDALWHTYYDGGLDHFTRGFIAFWRLDLEGAGAHFRATVTAAGGKGFADIARVYLVLIAAQLRDRAALDDAEAGLTMVPDHEMYGVPWEVYRDVADALVHEARSHKKEALEAVARVALTPETRGMVAHVAQLLARMSEYDSASRILDLLEGPQPSYVDTAALITRAIVEHAASHTSEAHVFLEQSLARAAPQNVLQPFAVAGAALPPLLSAHVARGTKYESFAARALAASTTVKTVEPLTRREREVLAYLQTPMSNAEIADAMFVSSNTLKTYQRTLYRKLGVASRREAIRRGATPTNGAARQNTHSQ